MKVFIAYSRKDEAFVHALRFILEEKKIKCLMDKQVDAGAQWYENIHNMIETADIVLVVVTGAAIQSSWVNQEIGVALCKEKIIIPLKLEDTDLPGGLNEKQAYPFLSWERKENFSDLIETLIKTKEDDYRQKHGLNFFISDDPKEPGYLKRTQFMVRQLKKLVDSKRKVSIYNHAVFSAFAISKDPEYIAGELVDREFIEEHIGYILQERELLQKLILTDRNEYYLLVSPSVQGKVEHNIRFEYLRNWMIEHQDVRNIHFCCGGYIQANLFLIEDKFYIESVYDPQKGYAENYVVFHKGKIAHRLNKFRKFYETNCSGQSKKQAIKTIEDKWERNKKCSRR